MISSAEETIKSSLKGLGRDFYEKYLEHAIFFSWASIVGERLASQVKPLALEGKVLYVSIENASWRTEFQFHKSDVMGLINAAVECNLVEEIKLGSVIKSPERAWSGSDEELWTADETVARDLPNIELTDEEISAVESSLPPMFNENVRAAALGTSLARARLEKCRIKHGWHRCAKCEILVPPRDVLCDGCRRAEVEKFRRTIAEIIRDVPWLTYAEIYEEMRNRMPHMIGQCYPETVSSVRSTLVQSMARSVDVRDQDQVRRLVMIYRQVPPDQLSAEAIRKTMRRLRFDLPMHADDI